MTMASPGQHAQVTGTMAAGLQALLLLLLEGFLLLLVLLGHWPLLLLLLCLALGTCLHLWVRVGP
jgi:hypothetical protein